MYTTFYAASEQLRRKYQEDRYVIPKISDDDYQLYAVFDGHGGSDCSQMCAEALNGIFRHLKATHPGLGTEWQLFATFYHLAAKSAEAKFRKVGCTATIILIENNELWAANVGDSSAYLFTQTKGFIELTEVQQPKPDLNPHEYQRIIDLGARVLGGRINGSLAVTRAIGDLKLQPLVSWRPFIRHIELDVFDDAFIVLASDGLWDCANPAGIAELAQSMDYDAAATVEALRQGLLDRSNASDNATIIGISLVIPEDTPGYTFNKQMLKDLKN